MNSFQVRFPSPSSESCGALPLVRRRDRGFTMVELLVVMAIVGILLSLATPSMAKFIADWRVNSAVNSMTRDFRLARAESIKRSRRVIICRANAALSACAGSVTPKRDEWKDGWLVFVDNDFSDTYTSNTDEVLAKQRALPGIKTFISGQVVTFTFLPNGLMKRSGNNTSFNVQSALGGDDPLAEKGFCVAASGRVRKTDSSANCN